MAAKIKCEINYVNSSPLTGEVRWGCIRINLRIILQIYFIESVRPDSAVVKQIKDLKTQSSGN